MTTSGVSLPCRSSCRRCRTYCISNFSCGPSRSSWIISLASGSRGEAIGELVDFGSPVHLPGVGVGLAERRGSLRPELAVRDAAGRARRGLLDRLRVGQPRVQVGPAGAFPSLRVQTAHTAARGAVTAAGHAATLVRALPPPLRIGRRDEPIHRRASLIDPPLQMPLTQAAATGGSLASRDPARGSAEHRVLWPEFQDVTAEFAANLGHQLAQQPRRTGRLQRRRGHSRTRPSANQPACSMTRRASSTVRCP